MTTYDYGLAVIGAGTGGLTVARLAAKAGRRVALIERDRPGGDCLWTGCVPTKSLIQVAHVMHAARTGARFGVIAGDLRLDFAAAKAHVAAAQAAAGEVDSLAAIASYGVELVSEEAKFLDSHRLSIGERQLTAEFIVIATGSSPVTPDIPGLREAGFDTNVEALGWDELPQTLGVIGGGPIGVEFAQAMGRLGAKVTLLHNGPRILERDDPKASEVVTSVLRREGVEVRTGANVTRVERTATGRLVSYSHEGRQHVVEVERLLVATGRRPNIEAIDPAAAGIRVAGGKFVLDGQLRTSQPHIFVAGDAAGGHLFTHVAEAQGRMIANLIAGKRFQRWSDRVVPRVTYTSPEVASVGLQANQARKAGIRGVRTWEVPLSAVDRAITMGETDGFLRLVTGKGWSRFVPGLRKLMGDEIVGACLVAPNAGDLLVPVVMAMRARLPIGLVAWNMQAYPTLGLGIRQVAGLPFEDR